MKGWGFNDIIYVYKDTTIHNKIDYDNYFQTKELLYSVVLSGKTSVW